MTQEDQGYFTIELELPEGATVERSREITERALAFLLKDPDVEDVLNVTGSSPRVGTNRAHTTLTVILKPWEERETDDINEVRERIRASLAGYPESNVYIFTPPVIPGLARQADSRWCSKQGVTQHMPSRKAQSTLLKNMPNHLLKYQTFPLQCRLTFHNYILM